MSHKDGRRADDGQRKPAVFRLAHVSDVHLGPLPRLQARDWTRKRILGAANWYRTRRRVHDPKFVGRLLQDLRQHAVDHIAVTGDLTNLGLRSEFERMATWLAQLGSPDRVSVVPGNHDAHRQADFHAGLDLWADYMASDQTELTQNLLFGAKRATDNPAGASGKEAKIQRSVRFPFLRLRDQIALVGLNSGYPTLPFSAAGRVPKAELTAFEQLMQQLGDLGYFRCVIIHHPPFPGLTPPRRALENATTMKRILMNVGAELVLYGHNHRNFISRFSRDGSEISARKSPCDVVGVGIASASAVKAASTAHLARYNLYEIDLSAPDTHEPSDTWRVRMIGRGIHARNGPISQLEEQVFEIRCKSPVAANARRVSSDVTS